MKILVIMVIIIQTIKVFINYTFTHDLLKFTKIDDVLDLDSE